ncbi:MAG: DEAD/DEAH box helicase [Patescibacteria group bacterium]
MKERNTRKTGNSKYSHNSKYRTSNNKKQKSYGKGNRFKEKIAHHKYISKVTSSQPEPNYVPSKNFYDFGFDSKLEQNILNRGYINPTKIQDQTIPHILKGKDVLGIGSTGSGKTGAFLIPTINSALKDKKMRTLILSPTRELASQIYAEFREFAQDTPLRMVLIIGGASIRDQVRLLKNRPAFVVATPGRLMDIEERNSINLSDFNCVILDEVDQMLAMGFVEDIRGIIAKLPAKKQALFFSATMGVKEEAIANSLLNTPVKVETYRQSPLKTIDQDVVKVKNKEHKITVLYELLQKSEFHKVLVFSGTKVGADMISDKLRKRGVKIDSLHGDKSQHKRSRVLSKFRQDKIDVLVATDVAARGIDIPDISHVINFDEPASYNDYIHRIGRTGRIGKKGVALTFVYDNSNRS